METKIKIIIFSLFVLILMGCSSEPPQTLNSIPTPQGGKAVLAGQLLNQEGKPLANVPLRLAEVYHDENDPKRGAYVLDTAFSPGTISDEKGFFAFIDINPGEYVLVVGNVELNNYVIVTEDDGQAKIWNLSADNTTDIGTLKVPFTK